MMNILIILVNLILGGLYLWAANTNRHYCIILWVLIPLLNTILLAIKERNE